MENLYIHIENGNPVNHPMVESNVRMIYPNFDPGNLPPNLAEFERTQFPALGIYEKFDTSYEWDGNIIKEIHRVYEMTDEEKLEKQNQVKTNWYSSNGYASWVFDEEMCGFIPPVPRPDNSVKYVWDEELQNWVLRSDLLN
jgi:hypothetical protein